MGTKYIQQMERGLLDEITHLIAEKAIVKENVSDELRNSRYEICLGCNFRDKKKDKCTVCGCFLDLKTGAKINWNAKKLRNEKTHCPLGKWNDLETANEYRRIDGKQPLN